MGKHSAKKKQQIQKPPRKFKFYLGSRQRYIEFSSDFDSGNIACVRQLTDFHYRLASVHDGTYTDHYVNSKSWFYFSVKGFPRNTKGKFIVTKINTLSPIFYSKYAKSYRPVYRVEGKDQWLRIPTVSNLVMRENGDLQCDFQYIFKNQDEKVYFAFCYPYSYEKNIKYLDSLSDFFYHEDFYFHKQVLAFSPQKRHIHLLTITSYDHKAKNEECEDLFNEKLFPQNNRPFKFDKPVILISARVHPGQSAASYTMQGVINFLTNTKDLRANLLRKMFVFMIVPMINVDGVFHGHFRMDIYGKNLNRYYIDPCPEKHPAIYGIKQLANYLNKDSRLAFYFDLHAHNAKKGCFIYGNAINDFVQQVQSQVFCKLISMNNKIFQYEYCNFSERHMNARDRNQDLTKQGCGRVVMYRLAGIIHSYSLQCGIVSSNKMTPIPDPINTQFKLQQKGFTEDSYEHNDSPHYKMKGDENPLFTIPMYQNLGKNLLVSVLDVFDKNPYSRVYNSKYKSMDVLRRLTAFEIFHEAERFRMFERFVFGKVKKINDLIKEVLNTKLHYRKLYNLYFYDDPQLKAVTWPDGIPGLNKPKIQSPTRKKRFRASLNEIITVNGKQYSQKFAEILQKLKLNQTTYQTEENQLKMIEGQQSNNSDQSSQTEDLSPIKISQLQLSQEKFTKYLADQNCESEDLSKFYDNHVESQQQSRQYDAVKSYYQLQRFSEFESPIKLIKTRDNHSQARQQCKKPIQSSPVRVRRLLRQQEHRAATKAAQQQIVIQQEQNTSMASEFRKKLFQSIKQQIREGLRKQQQRKTLMNLQSIPIQFSGNRSVISDRKKNGNKCWSVKKCQNRRGNGKVQLPSLGSQMFIISTSTKLINKKN